MFITKIIVVLILSSSTFSEKPFLDLSYPDAIKEAKSSGKLVMLDFYTTWCGPCKMLDKTTWKDEKVQAWLEEYTIPLKVDAEKLRPVAKKFEVSAYPTIVFIDGDEKVVGRFVGYKSPEQFIPAAENALAGIAESSIARKRLKGGKSNPMTRIDLGKKLLQEKKYEEALEQFAWCWEHGEEEAPSFSGVRVSFLLTYMQRLANKYPPALAKMKTWRDEAKKSFDSKDATRENCTDYFSLEKYLGTSETELLAIYDGLSERGKKGKVVQSWVGYHVDDALFAQDRFEEYLNNANIDNIITSLSMSKHLRVADEYKKMLVDHDVNRSLQPFEALLVLKQDEKADKLLKALFELDAS